MKHSVLGGALLLATLGMPGFVLAQSSSSAISSQESISSSLSSYSSLPSSGQASSSSSSFSSSSLRSSSKSSFSPPASGRCIQLSKTFRRGHTDARTDGEVSLLQEFLNAHGAKLIVGGTFNPQTTNALRAWERAEGLRPSVVVTFVTRRRIREISCGTKSSQASSSSSLSSYMGIKLQLITPNGAEIFKPDLQNSIRWNGGSGFVKVALIDSRFEQASHIIGWIMLDASPNGTVTWRAKEVCNEAMDTCRTVKSLSEGPYRILLLSKNEAGVYCTDNASCNMDVSDTTFTIAAE